MSITSAGLFAYDELILPKADIARATLTVHGSGVLLHRRRQMPALLRCRTPAEATNVLRVLQCDAGNSIATFWVASPIASDRWTWGSVLLALGLAVNWAIGPTYGAGGAIFFLAVLSPILIRLRHGKLTIGSDGLLRRWVWSERFVPVARVRAASVDGDQVRVEVTGDDDLILRAPTPRADEA